MQQAGRKSAAALTVLRPTDAVEVLERPRPPAELTDDQARVWQTVVDTRAAGWFSADTHPLLIAYCKHVVEARRIDALLDGYDSEWLKTDEGLGRYEKLLKLRDQQTKAVVTLSRQMRLSQQAQYHKDAKGNRAQPAKKPWQS